MRIAIVAVFAILLTPSASAHGEGGFGHLNVDVAELAPRATKIYHLDPSNEGGDITLSQGWVFGVYGGLQGNATDRVELYLYHEGVPIATWVWGPGYHANTTRLHFTGEYEIRAYNPGNATLRYAIYYDQSCNCKGKLIPLPGGWNLFNYDLPAGRDVQLGFPLARTSHVRGALATLESQDDARWPQDFKVLQRDEARGPEWLNFTFTTTAAQRYYVYVEAIDGAQIEAPLYLTPLLEVEEKASPAVTGWTVLALLAALVLVVRRRPA